LTSSPYRTDDKFPLGDELFLIAHDGYTGKATVAVEVLETGLAGALLGELMFARRVVMAGSAVAAADPRPWQEPVSDYVIAELLRKGDAYPVRAWVEYLRGDLRERIGQRLVRRSVVRREETRSALTRRITVRYPAVDPVLAARPRVRLGYVLGQPTAMDDQSALLAALVHATGMDRLFVELYGQVARDQMAGAARVLPPSLGRVAAGVDTAVAAIALTVRR
jgi:Golgi phosphoprotein 3 (GPP34)